MKQAQQIALAARPAGRPKPTDFRLETTPIPTAGPGQMLLRTRYLSLDPYMRGRMDDRRSYAAPVPLGGVMEAETVSVVEQSHRPDFAPGDHVVARTGWRTHAAWDGPARRLGTAAPISTGLGVLGMPGFTAYGGLLLIGRPKPGETVVVAAASGPVGSLVGQLAKEEGARAVGIAGGPDKCAYLLTIGFDAAIDHRAPDFPAQLAAACPGGVDVYFENVGGPILQAVLPLLNLYARIPVCGLISQYSGIAEGANQLPGLLRDILTRSLTLRGFINTEFAAEHHAPFLERVGAGVAAGRIKYREDVVQGLEHAPEAFIGLLEGKNFGKLLIEVSA